MIVIDGNERMMIKQTKKSSMKKNLKTKKILT